MRLPRLGPFVLMLAACSSQTIVASDEAPDVRDASVDHAPDASTGGLGGQGGGGAGGIDAGKGGAAGRGGGSGGGAGSSGAAGRAGAGGIGGSAGDAGAGGFGGMGGTAGSGTTGGMAGSGGAAGAAGTGANAGAAGQGGLGGNSGSAGSGGSTGGLSGAAGSGGKAGNSGTGSSGKAGSGGSGGMFDAGSDVIIGPPLPPWNDPSCPSGGGSPLLGTWVGYVENHKFSSGSDALRLTIVSADATSVCGALVFGDATPLPQPRADIGYPPNFDWTPGLPALLPVEGFAHSLFGALVSNQRVRFQVLGLEPWRAWCKMQTSYAVDYPDPGFRCIDGRGWQDRYPDGGRGACWVLNAAGVQSPVDCGKWNACEVSPVCVCNSSACGADNTIYPMDFDAQFEAGQAHGSILLNTDMGVEAFNVNFVKTD